MICPREAVESTVKVNSGGVHPHRNFRESVFGKNPDMGSGEIAVPIWIKTGSVGVASHSVRTIPASACSPSPMGFA